MTTSLTPLVALDIASYYNTILHPRTRTLHVSYRSGSAIENIKIELDIELSKYLMTLRKYKSGAGYEIFSYQIQELVDQERVAAFKRKLQLLITQ